ncbi:succinylglutamate desuccinylase [Alteromonas macleodii str. 'Black Sea 11']|nr:succinylglutamate desuccinylase [Alteromonas macleodii str. 'Black Sea 11']NKW90825.1 succinylglutamate desuccinylase [Alteromonadaceae bacterium A_SAG4]NKX05610.1 succinylglutamate desuccinylase [Alteromonadaceae bacterium A_SAG6]NKX35817.1 succinylglutamate desuccinylase [Alteromonadaceae bacterium A_SAG3]
MQELIESGQFLTLSRRNPALFERAQQFTLANGTRVDISAPGIISFTVPATSQQTKRIILSCGVHGNETAPIEICDDLVKGILTGALTLAHDVLFLFGNLPAMDIAERFVEENMNRLFSGAHSKGEGLVNAERVRAKQLEEAVASFFEAGEGTRYHYDLHTAIRASKNEKFAVYPYLHERVHSKGQLAFLAACGVKTILLSESSTTTFSYFSSYQFNAHAFTVELGKVRPFGQNDMSRFEDARQAITQLITQAEYAPTVDMNELDIYRVNQVINRNEEQFTLHFDDDTPNFTDYPKGTVLASEQGKEYVAEQDGEAIVFPNAKVAIGQRALLTVVPTTLEKLDV